MFERIISKKLAFPSKIPISNKMKDLIIGLLAKNPAERVNKDNVKTQDLFGDTNWDDVKNLK